MRRWCAMLLAVSLFASAQVEAQERPVRPSVDAGTVEVRLRDASVLYGRIVEERDAEFVLLTGSGTRVEIARDQVVSIRDVVGQGTDGDFWTADPSPTRRAS